MNMRPDFRHATGSVWQFPADLHLVDWLDEKGYEYDVVTDLELHDEGRGPARPLPGRADRLAPRVLLASACSNAWEEYLGDGGRAMYLGSNGFYWVTSWHPEKPWMIEVRKCEQGSRAWQAKPGEYYHATSGERGGLWRTRARAPQKLFGVGFTSEGFDRCCGYHQMSDAADARAAFIMEGVERDEVIGDFGLAGGGAAGFEIDRYELALGTPPNALLLASSLDHSVNYPHVSEEICFNYPGLDGTNDFMVRADLVYFTTQNGGAVFSTSSISWCGSLSHDGYDNNVSRIMENVLEPLRGRGGAARARLAPEAGYLAGSAERHTRYPWAKRALRASPAWRRRHRSRCLPASAPARCSRRCGSSRPTTARSCRPGIRSRGGTRCSPASATTTGCSTGSTAVAG